VRCREVRKWLLRSLDGILDPSREKAVDDHIKLCSRCRKLRQEYRTITHSLRRQPDAEPLPHFWERLQSKLKDRERQEPEAIWLKWCLRAIPVSLILIGFFIGAIAFWNPSGEEEMSQPEALLLRNANPIAETKTFFEEEKLENRNMMIIFTGDEKVPDRR